MRHTFRKGPSVNFINVLLACFLYKILAPKITKPNITREKLPKSCQKRLKYEKGARKMLMKLTPSVVKEPILVEYNPHELYERQRG